MFMQKEEVAQRNGKSGDFSRWGGYGVSIVFLALATLAVSFGSQTPPAKSLRPYAEEDTTPTPAITDTLTNAERQWATAHAQGNPTLIIPLMSGDFVATDAVGTVRNGQTYIHSLVPSQTPDTPSVIHPISLDIRVYGSVAVVIGQDKFGSRTERFTHVYKCSGTQWKIVASQATRLKG
jgi:hypothetical protein